jgi:short-subunit dehydrogenase
MKSAGMRQTALITGGSSGIGYAIARELAARNYDLILVSNQGKQLEEACRTIVSEFGVEARPIDMDLAESNAAANLFNRCQNEKIPVDVLVNNAGIFFFGEVPETDTAKVKDIIALHTTTPAVLCTLFGKEMKDRRSGNILIISSLAAYMPYPGIAMYNATKLFLKGF